MAQKLTVWNQGGGPYPDVFVEFGVFAQLDKGDWASACDFFRSHPEYVPYYYQCESLMHLAARYNSPELLATLVELGLDVNIPQQVDPAGPVSEAIYCRNMRAVRWLLEHGAKPHHEWNGILYSGGTLSAVAKGDFELVELLVEHGAPIDKAVDNPPRTFLTTAIQFGHTKIADYLRSKGALTDEEVKARDKKKRKKS